MIGIFDSGSGGLTVLRAIREHLRTADVLYFGDIKNAPYGPKTRAELTQLTVGGIKLLKDRGASNIVSACNSVSASLAVSLLDAFSFSPQQLIEMVGPTVSFFKGSNARLALCATQATIDSGIYQNAFQMIGKDIEAIAIPDLAAAIEFGESEERIRSIITEALPEPRAFDILILGCTHYPLAIDAFQEVLGKDVLIFDPAVAVAERVERQFWPQESGDKKTSFIISKESQPFRDLVARIFPQAEYSIEVLE